MKSAITALVLAAVVVVAGWLAIVGALWRAVENALRLPHYQPGRRPIRDAFDVVPDADPRPDDLMRFRMEQRLAMAMTHPSALVKIVNVQ
jgi:hypothetical protein